MRLVSWYKKDPLNIWLSVIVFLFAFIVYLYTMAPTVSFWDCGEFIACSYILGVPHPPGTPLFVLIGRVFTLLPLFGSIAPRVNFISVLSSALTVWLAYLLIVRVAGHILRGKESTSGGWTRVAGYVGGVSGSLFLGFSRTYWSNAVEAEVYGVAMLLMVLIAYLGLLWLERKGEPGSDRLLVLIGFLGMISIGVHMTVYLIMPAIFLLVILEDKSKLKDIRFWVSGIILSLVMFTLVPFLISLVLWLLISFIFWQLNPHSRGWNFVFALILFAVIGYTVQLYIPIRSRLEPAIDENDPNNWESFRYFLERKQYGQVSMIDRMFTRRGSWKSQLGVHERMGFWGFFREQYLDKSLWIIPILLGFLGVFESIRRVKGIGWMLLFLILVSSIGLVLYLNFGDGTRTNPLTGEIERLEVRDRDYFFTPAFVFFALAMGLGISQVLSYVGEELNKLKIKELVNKFAVYGLSAIFLLAPILPLDSGLHSPNNRRNNYIPYDYAYNILVCCDQDAILFTNGDNDTFPLWFIQEVKNFRKDVRVINLSLANTNWYMKQRKDEMNVPISLSYDQIKWSVQVKRSDGTAFFMPKEKYYDPLRGTNHYLFAYFDQNAKTSFRIQDLMIEHIILTNQWKYPIYFSSTVPPDSRLNLDNHLRKAGFGMKLVSEEGNSMFDADKYHRLLWEVYKYRGLNDLKVYKDENAIGMMVSYPEMFIELSNYYLSAGEREKATVELEKAIEVYPDYYRPYTFLASLYKEDGREKEADSLLKKAEERLKSVYQVNPQLLYLQYLGLFYINLRKTVEAEDIFYRAYKESPDNAISVRALSDLYIINGKFDRSIAILEKWLMDHPNDQAVSNVLQKLRNRK
jgi:tetratricopeptide (TPR) repeat protein